MGCHVAKIYWSAGMLRGIYCYLAGDDLLDIGQVAEGIWNVS